MALIGMAAFHADWDLAYVGWTAGPHGSALWTGFGHLVAGTFLFLSGLGLVLAEPKGLRPALRRLALIAAAAAAITAVTRALFPEDAIYFGILHCIVFTNVLALGLLRVPSFLVASSAVLALAAPWIAPPLDGGVWWWTGLAATVPQTLDYRPVFPWLGVVLAGLLAGRWARRRSPSHYPGSPSRAQFLTWVGRHSLALYLVHQPILFGAVLGASLAFPRLGPDRFQGFVVACREQCVATGANTRMCAAACGCAAARTAAGLKPLAGLDRDAALREAEACFRETSPLVR